MNTQVAQTIIQQLGGGQFAAMVGLNTVIAHPEGVQFNIGAGAACGIRKVRIFLTPSDVYTMEFFSKRNGEWVSVQQYDEVYCDMLQDLFEQTTGFYTTLFPRQ